MSFDGALSREEAYERLEKRLRSLDAALVGRGIDIIDIENSTIKKVDLNQRFTKDGDGEIQVVDLVNISIAPGWDSGPEWPVVQPGAAPALPKVAKRKAKAKKWLTATLLPDMQIGYFLNADNELEPIHDEAAMAVAFAIVEDEQPDVIVLHGDNLDFADFSSKFRVTPAFSNVVQATIDRATLMLAQLRSIAPHARICWLEGNHEARLGYYINDNAKKAFGLKRGMEPEGWPVMSVQHLCRLDEYGVEYFDGYPAGKVWLNDNFIVVHGHKVDSKGITATKYLDDARVSYAFGHIHRRELAQRTRETVHGPRTVTAVSFGCLARIDGVVPSTNQGTDANGRPVKGCENWQQGMGIVRYQPGDGLHVIENIEILNGWAMYNGKEYTHK